jgi:hypothetical protein
MSVDWDSLVIGPCHAVFGDPVDYTPSTGAPFSFFGVFDAEYIDQNVIGGMIDQIGLPGNITGARPVLGVQLSAFPAGVVPRQGDTFIITGGQHIGEQYKVMEVRPDGRGEAKLLLNKAP